MSGSLVLLDSVTASSSSTVSLGAGNWDTSYNVYKVVMTGITPSSDSTNLRMRVLKSGTAQTDSNYDRAYLQYRTDTTYGIVATVGGDYWETTNNSNGTTAGETAQGIFYLFNFNNSSEYSFVTMENATTRQDTSDELFGFQGGGVHTVAETNDGINFFLASGNNIAGGTFKLYGLVK